MTEQKSTLQQLESYLWGAADMDEYTHTFYIPERARWARLRDRLSHFSKYGAALTAWYKDHAGQKLSDRAGMYADRVGVSYRAVKVKDMKSQWGSCTKTGDIHFNWRIVMAPTSIVDYVVVHELCHREHRDHSRPFWRLLGRRLPDYRERKEWLRVKGALLIL
jgi:predicted metal-dependent hydrolase